MATNANELIRKFIKSVKLYKLAGSGPDELRDALSDDLDDVITEATKYLAERKPSTKTEPKE